MFKFFFSESTLDAITTFTNAQATEMVYKRKVERSDGKFYYEVCMCVTMLALECVHCIECVIVCM